MSLNKLILFFSLFTLIELISCGYESNCQDTLKIYMDEVARGQQQILLLQKQQFDLANLYQINENRLRSDLENLRVKCANDIRSSINSNQCELSESRIKFLENELKIQQEKFDEKNKKLIKNNYLFEADTCLDYGDERISPNGCFKLIFEWNGNLVIYRQRDNHPIWDSKTFGKGGNRTCMQGDGNLVIYTAGNGVVFRTRTQGNHGSNAHIQDDGNFVIYKAGGGHSWASQKLSKC